MTKHEVDFEYEKETKNTYRYAEVVTNSPPKVNTLYVQKWAFPNKPEKLRVIIETVE